MIIIVAMIKSSTYFQPFQRVCGWWKQTRKNTEWTFELLSETFFAKIVGKDVSLTL